MKTMLSVIAALLATAVLDQPAHAAAPAPSNEGEVVVVQAVPGADVDISVDGRSVARQAGVGSLTGPLRLSSGQHQLVFSGVPGGRKITTRLRVEPGSSRDVVLHQPASVHGEAVVNTYRTPQSPIGPGKARLLLAHTATVAPADVRFDGSIVFRNIANGEYADADVPAGSHRVALLATGTTKDPILGPLTVKLDARTATMVYAVGDPSNGSMNAITHTVPLGADGSTAPTSMDTGSAGLVTSRVVPFGERAVAPRRPRTLGSPEANGGERLALLAGGLGLLLLGTTTVGRFARSRSRTRSGRRAPAVRHDASVT